VTFSTEGNNIFYLELAMDKTEFIQMEEFEVEDNVSPDSILENERNKRIAEAAPVVESNDMADDLLDELGI
jgi:hypothetical protein